MLVSRMFGVRARERPGSARGGSLTREEAPWGSWMSSLNFRPLPKTLAVLKGLVFPSKSAAVKALGMRPSNWRVHWALEPGAVAPVLFLVAQSAATEAMSERMRVETNILLILDRLRADLLKKSVVGWKIGVR